MKDYNGYELTDQGTVRGPGKFEGEWFPTIYFYDVWNSGGADAEYDFGGDGYVDAIAFFTVSADDVRCVPELEGTYGCLLHNDDQGFISAAWYDDKEKYDAAIARCEEQAERMAEEAEEEGEGDDDN